MSSVHFLIELLLFIVELGVFIYFVCYIYIYVFCIIGPLLDR